jgi:hypothetical protein
MREPRDVVTIANVRAISNGLALICEVDGRRFGVPTYEIDPTSEVRRPGDVGMLVVARELVPWLGVEPAVAAAAAAA